MLIFVIEDEPLQLRAAERMIAECVPGAGIQTFSNAEDALTAITEEDAVPDIVFSDIEMPGLSGLELAVKLKTVVPNTRIIFVTAYSRYALDAFRIHAQGYIMKPLTTEAIREELNAVPVSAAPEPDKLQVRCFGHFEVFWQGEPVIFIRKQTKELLAILIDREGAACTAEEIIPALWENETDMPAAGQRLRNLISDLKNTLQGIGMEGLLIRKRRQIAIRKDLVDCDYYRMLEGRIEDVNAYRGEYMIDYSWAELTAGKLYFRQK
jgi:two-component SAPR family response regulator